jgi:hypothetical protein
MLCAAAAAMRWAIESDALARSLLGTSSSAPPAATATEAAPTMSPAKLPRPVKVTVVDAPPAMGPSVHAKRF